VLVRVPKRPPSATVPLHDALADFGTARIDSRAHNASTRSMNERVSQKPARRAPQVPD
jgi:hypothetical protein